MERVQRLASGDMIKRLADQFNEDARKVEMKHTLQDFSDSQIANLLYKYRPESWWDLQDVLIMQTSNEDVIAHILGFASAKARQAEIEKTKEMQGKVEEWINEH